VKANQARRFHCLIEVAVHRLPHFRAQFFERIALGVDSESERGRRETTLDIVLVNLKDYFCRV
jgi:hypothetical protein